MTSDPIGDAIIRLKNGYMARRREVALPRTRRILAILDVLKKQQFIAGIERQKGEMQTVSVRLKYEGDRPAMEGVKRMSRPSRRLYYSAEQVRAKKPMIGALILSTSAGLMTSDMAIKKHVGGEVLFRVW